MGILDEPDKFISKAIERGNPATAKVADKDCIAELAEIAGGPYYAPGRVEPRAMLKVSDVLARGREDLDKAIAVAGHIIGKRRGVNHAGVAGAGAGYVIANIHKSDIVVKRGTIVHLKLLEPITTVG